LISICGVITISLTKTAVYVFNDCNELHQVVNAAREKVNMLIGWFTTNIEDMEARRYTYATFPPYYVWNKALKK